MKIFNLGFILLFIPLFAFTMHKYYVSSTKIEYKKENGTLQITMRIFIDDLQETINNTYQNNFELAVSNEPKELDSLINNYTLKKFEVIVDEDKKTYSFLGKEYKNDEIYLYFEISNIKRINSIEVKNEMLTEIFPDQKNIIKLYINNIKKTFLLTNRSYKDLLKL